MTTMNNKMNERIELNDEFLEMVAGGKPSDCGSEVDQYAVCPGRSYYLHYTAGGHDEWFKVDILDVYEKECASILGLITFTKRTAKLRIQLTQQETEIPINEPGCICEIAA